MSYCEISVIRPPQARFVVNLMDLLLEVKSLEKGGSTKHRISNGVYVLGSKEESDLGTPIQLDGTFVRKDHALLEHTRAGWMITALQPQIRRCDRGNEPLVVRTPMKFGPNSRFVIGTLEFQFLIPDEVEDEEQDEDLNVASLDRLISDIHLKVSAETQMLTRIEKPDVEDKKYQGDVLEIIIERVESALMELDGHDLYVLAGDAGRRDLVYRVLGGQGVMAEDGKLGISAMDVTDFARIQNQMIKSLRLELHEDFYVEDLDAINANYELKFFKASSKFNNSVLRRLLKKTLVQSIWDIMFGIGPLEYLQKNEEISEIMVVAYNKIFVELGGSLIESGLSFVDEKSSQTITSYIVGRVNKSISVQNPYEDARLSDGSRVNAVIPPIALDGTALTIRKFGKSALTLEQLLAFDCMSPAMASFLHGAVVSKKNIIVSGGTGTGKTTMVNWMATMIPSDERVVTVEDTAELRLGLPHVVRLEARPPSSAGEGEVSIRDLVANALRMRPDRIVVGECRRGEAFDMLQAMNTGHEGSMTTLHANNPVEAVSRLENLVMQAGEELPLDAIRYQIAGAVDFVVQLTRYPNGRRKISEIAEVGQVDAFTGRIEVNPVFRTFYDASQKGSVGEFSFAGRTPESIVEIIKGGFDPALFGN